MSTKNALLQTFRWAADGAAESSIRSVQEQLGVALPAEYLDVLRHHNGGEGFVGAGRYLQLWPIEDIAEHNRTLEAAQLVPSAVLFGSDGADDLYAIEVHGEQVDYVVYPAIGLSRRFREYLAGSWEEFLEKLAST